MTLDAAETPFAKTPFSFFSLKVNTNFFVLSNFSGNSGISRQNPGISRQKCFICLVSRGMPNFLTPTPSRGRPLPLWKTSRLKNVGLCSFFVPEFSRARKIADPFGFCCIRLFQSRRVFALLTARNGKSAAKTSVRTQCEHPCRAVTWSGY